MTENYDNDYNNISFDINTLLDEKEQEHIMTRIKEMSFYIISNDDTVAERKILKLHTLLSKYKEFETRGTDFSVHNSGIIYSKGDTEVYYFVGSNRKNSDENYVYIFKDFGLTESNLNVEYLGRVGKGNILYEKILDENYSRNKQ